MPDAGQLFSHYPLPAGAARYVRIQLHATGGIGQVWLVRDETLGREIALKELRPHYAGLHF